MDIHSFRFRIIGISRPLGFIPLEFQVPGIAEKFMVSLRPPEPVPIQAGDEVSRLGSPGDTRFRMID